MITLNGNYEYGICESTDEQIINEMAECLAETFAGVQVGSTFIKEPMSFAINLTKDSLAEYAVGYIKSISADGLCVYAKDKNSGRVVGALASENFNPEEEPPVLEGALKPINLIFEFLNKLDERFIKTVEIKTGAKIQKNEYVHTLMLGVRTERDKKYIAANMLELLIETAKTKMYKGVFGEPTNFRSQKLISNFFNYYVVKDFENLPISIKYKDDNVFNTIPEDVAIDCCVMYKPLDDKFKI